MVFAGLIALVAGGDLWLKQNREAKARRISATVGRDEGSDLALSES